MLRRSLGEQSIVTRGDEEVGVDFERLWCDVACFDAAVQGSRPRRRSSFSAVTCWRASTFPRCRNSSTGWKQSVLVYALRQPVRPGASGRTNCATSL
jgi:hypothetical protein